MRIDRIRLKNFAGVTDAEVRFAPTGVTIVHGPNEAGKSTLMNGINVLFDYKDDSRHEDVRRTKPVNRDVGSEVEADVEVGEYRFTYFKRFHKDRETRLSVHAPKAESLVGREAHDRVQQILTGTVDTALWQALRIVQGRNLEMPQLHSQPALAQALDKVAGQAKSGEKEEALFDAARSEYGLYFTGTGKEKEDPVVRARARADEAAEGEGALRLQLKTVEDDIGRFSTLERSAATLRRSLAGLEGAQQKAQVAWDAVSKLAENAERAKAAHQLADQAMQAARSVVKQRSEMNIAATTAATKLKNATDQNAKSSAALAAAAQTLNAAKAKRDAARVASNQCDAEEQIRRLDHEFRVEEFELLRMEERLAHVTKAHAAATAASAVVAATKITDKLRAGIRSAEIALKTAQGILNSASPQLAIKALKAVKIAVNGQSQAFAAGEERVFAVTEPVFASIADAVEVRVDPGASAESLHQAVVDAQSALAKACAKAGVASPEEAESAWAALQDATRTVADRDRIAKEHLRDLTREKLAELIQASKARVQAYSDKRNSELALPVNLEEAKALAKAAEKSAAAARTALQEAEAQFALVQEHHTQCREGDAANTALLQQAKNDDAMAAERLEAERKRASDDALQKALTAAEAAAAVAQDALNAAELSLRNADPESAKAILDTSASALKSAQHQREEQERELLRLRTTLDLVGEQGLAEALAEAERAAFEAKDALDRMLRRARAAKLLYDTLAAEREAMRKAYVAPLREGIERLGRHVFGPTLQAEVDENLCLVSRTIDGVTVSLEQLSTGAREQMGLLVRLAVAAIVSKDGGVPLVLDDALGSTDEGRLESMGAVLRIASQDGQTIILTCAPERYVHVGAQATVGM